MALKCKNNYFGLLKGIGKFNCKDRTEDRILNSVNIISSKRK